MQMGLGLGIDGLLYPLDQEAMNLLEINDSDLEEIMAELVDILIDSDTF